MLNHFLISFTALFVLNAILTIERKIIPIGIIIAAFFILVVFVIIYLVYRIRLNITKLLHHELKFTEILTGYVTSVIFIIILFSILYFAMTLLGVGYLKYGSCVDNVDITRQLIDNDPLRVKEFIHYPYFSAVTFFTVGFGDICPMGTSKLISVLNALIGNLFTVLILAIAITNYSTNKGNEKDNKDNENKGKQ